MDRVIALVRPRFGRATCVVAVLALVATQACDPDFHHRASALEEKVRTAEHEYRRLQGVIEREGDLRAKRESLLAQIEARSAAAAPGSGELAASPATPPSTIPVTAWPPMLAHGLPPFPQGHHADPEFRDRLDLLVTEIQRAVKL